MERKSRSGNDLFLTRPEESAVFPNDSDDNKIKISLFSLIVSTNSNKIGLGMKPLVKILKYCEGYPVKINILKNENDNQPKRRLSIKIQNESQSQITKSEVADQNSQNLNQPIHQKIQNKNQDFNIEYIYETNMFSWAEAGFWYSYILHAVNLFSVVTFLCNIGLGIPYPVKLFSFGPAQEQFFGSTQQSYNAVIFIGTSVLNILRTIVIFWNSPAFVRWLNNWFCFQRDFENCFYDIIRNNNNNFYFTMETNTGRFLNRVLLPVLAFCWTVTGATYIFSIYTFQIEFVTSVIMLVGIFSISCHPIMEDVKVLMILKTQGLAFEQVLAGIKEWGLSRRLEILANDVIGWRHLVKQVRDQTVLASRCLKSQEMLSVAETILSCTIGVSYILNAVTQTQDNVLKMSFITTIFGNLFYGCSNFLRLYFKVLLAEKISATEQLVAEEVLQIDAMTGNAATKTELKFLYDEMTQNTVAVNYGNYFTLDKTLLLNVGAQVVTYLIVIMQFQSSK